MKKKFPKSSQEMINWIVEFLDSVDEKKQILMDGCPDEYDEAIKIRCLRFQFNIMNACNNMISIAKH